MSSPDRKRSSKPCSSRTRAIEDRRDEAEPALAAAGAVVVGERLPPVAGAADAVQPGLQAGVAAGLELVEQSRERARRPGRRRRRRARRARTPRPARRAGARRRRRALVAEHARAVAAGDGDGARRSTCRRRRSSRPARRGDRGAGTPRAGARRCARGRRPTRRARRVSSDGGRGRARGRRPRRSRRPPPGRGARAGRRSSSAGRPCSAARRIAAFSAWLRAERQRARPGHRASRRSREPRGSAAWKLPASRAAIHAASARLEHGLVAALRARRTRPPRAARRRRSSRRRAPRCAGHHAVLGPPAPGDARDAGLPDDHRVHRGRDRAEGPRERGRRERCARGQAAARHDRAVVRAQEQRLGVAEQAPVGARKHQSSAMKPSPRPSASASAALVLPAPPAPAMHTPRPSRRPWRRGPSPRRGGPRPVDQREHGARAARRRRSAAAGALDADLQAARRELHAVVAVAVAVRLGQPGQRRDTAADDEVVALDGVGRERREQVLRAGARPACPAATRMPTRSWMSKRRSSAPAALVRAPRDARPGAARPATRPALASETPTATAPTRRQRGEVAANAVAATSRVTPRAAARRRSARSEARPRGRRRAGRRAPSRGPRRSSARGSSASARARRARGGGRAARGS